jgi:hypothetical protein
LGKVNKVELWDASQERSCGYCAHSKILPDEDKIICQKKKNIFAFSDSCKKFEFDILKKNVKRQKRPNFSKFSKENFTL